EDFFLTNKEEAGGSRDITLEGGVWDYNNVGNPRKPDLFDLTGPTGQMFFFKKVTGLTLSGLTLMDPSAYYITLRETEDFLIENIDFEAPHLTANQDGVHLSGFCKNGVIRNLQAATTGATNDDFIALNADDPHGRNEAVNLTDGPIENILIDGIYAKSCHTFVRILSVCSLIRNIEINNIRGGCQAWVLNLDAARYCRTPIFKDGDYPRGVGNVENVRISNVCVSREGHFSTKALCCIETNCRSLVVRNFHYDVEANEVPCTPVMNFAKMADTGIILRGLNRSRADRIGGSCGDISVCPCPDPWRQDMTSVKAHIKTGETLTLPEGDIDELVINTNE
ncbi:MAG: hypothetical protein LBO80_02270, partial [Treponema sp.]|nr:hypothetical protein [Treponema sp.]